MNNRLQGKNLNVITLSKSNADSYIEISSIPNGQINLDFDQSQASFVRDGDNLLITIEEGGNIKISDYFTAEDHELPTFVLPSGEFVSGLQLVDAMSSNMNINAEATNDNSFDVDSSGIGEYSSNSGILIGGVDRLGALGTDFWNRNTEVNEDDYNFEVLNSQNNIITPSIISGGYIRAVLYNPGETTSPVSTSIFYSNGEGTAFALNPNEINYGGNNPSARYNVEISIPEGWDKSWVTTTFNPVTGRFEFRLTTDGIAEMLRLGLSGQDLVDFIKVKVTDAQNPNAPIFQYNVQIIGSNDPNFDSHHQDEFDKAQGGAYPNHKEENIGEFHQGKDETGSYNIVSSNNNDEIILNDTVLGGSQIHASGSAFFPQMAKDYNTIILNKGMNNLGGETKLTSYDGKLSVQNGVLSNETNANTFIHMGKGTVHITNNNDDGVSANKGTNSITANKIIIESENSGISATNNGSNSMLSG